MGTTTSLLTFEEFEHLPDEPGKLEFLDGKPFHLPPAILKHMEIAKRLFLILIQTPLKAQTYFVWVFRDGHAKEFRGMLKSQIVPGLEINLTELL
jgi:hypothetical protein